MGYETLYILTTEKIAIRKKAEYAKYQEEINSFINRENKPDGKGGTNYNKLKYADGQEAIKWYNHDEDMVTLSKKFPKALFLLRLIGDSTDTMWEKWYQNGKLQICEGTIVFPKYNPKKMKKFEN